MTGFPKFDPAPYLDGTARPTVATVATVAGPYLKTSYPECPELDRIEGEQTRSTPATVATVATLCPDPDAFEERAAIIEEGAGVPREWAEGFARLDTMPCPEGIRPERWRRVIDDAGRFIDCWAAQAAALGWATADVFGCDARKPEARLDRAGLVWLLDGRPIVAIGPDRAVIRTRTGAPLTCYRHDPADTERARRVPLWTIENHARGVNQ